MMSSLTYDGHIDSSTGISEPSLPKTNNLIYCKSDL